MKKMFIATLALMTGVAFQSASAQCCKEGEKPAAQMPCCQEGGPQGHCPEGEQKGCCKDIALMPVPLTTTNDSVSYAAGYMLSDGLTGFLQQQYQVSDEDMPFVLQGYRQAIARRDDPKQRAIIAGMQVAQMVNDRMVPRVETQYKELGDSLNDALVYAGFEAALRNDTTHYTTHQAKSYWEGTVKGKTAARDSAYKQAGAQFLAKNAKKKGVKTLPSGLQYKVIQQGKGDIPSIDDKVQVVYEGRTIDGVVFDATSKHNLPADKPYDVFGIKGLIKGWQEALTLMPVGSKWEIYIPYNLAYGERGAGQDIKPYSALIFTMELKGVTPKEPANPRTVTSQTAPVSSGK